MEGVERELLNAGAGVDSLRYQSVSGYSEEINVAASPTAGTGTLSVTWLMTLAFSGELVDVAGELADADTLRFYGTNDLDQVQILRRCRRHGSRAVLKLQNGACGDAAHADELHRHPDAARLTRWTAPT